MMAELECDGGCSYWDGPQEECSAHGRTPKELWEIIGELVAERDAALSTIAKVRELHQPAHAVFNWKTGLRYEEPCATCNGRAGVHECGCWADEDTEFVCRECDQPKRGGSRRVTPWPCPTIQALSPSLVVGHDEERGQG